MITLDNLTQESASTSKRKVFFLFTDEENHTLLIREGWKFVSAQTTTSKSDAIGARGIGFLWSKMCSLCFISLFTLTLWFVTPLLWFVSPLENYTLFKNAGIIRFAPTEANTSWHLSPLQPLPGHLAWVYPKKMLRTVISLSEVEPWYKCLTKQNVTWCCPNSDFLVVRDLCSKQHADCESRVDGRSILYSPVLL